MSDFFLYPLQVSPLTIMAVSVVALTLAGASIVGLVLVVAFLCVFTKYAYSVIEFSKDGEPEPPTFQSAFSSENLDIFFKQLAVLFLAGLILVPITLTGSVVLILIANLAVVLLLPASIVVLALTHEVFRSLNPGVLLTVVKAIGWRYLLLCVFLLLLSQGPSIGFGLMATTIGEAFAVPLTTLLSCYFSLVMCRLLGYTVYQNQGRLGFVSNDHEENSDLSEEELRKLSFRQVQANVEILVKEGDYVRAKETLKTALKDAEGEFQLEDYRHKLLFASAEYDLMLKNADRAIPRCQKGNRDDLAMSIYLDCLKADKTYRPESLLVAFRLAKSLYSKMNIAAAVGLLSGAHKRYPDDALVADAYMLAAEIFLNSNVKNGHEKGQQLIQFVKSRFPNLAVSKQMQALEATLSA